MDRPLEHLEKELRRWPAVEYDVELSGRHPRIVVRYGGAERFVPFSSTKVGHYGLMQKVTQLRRVLRELGAERE